MIFSLDVLRARKGDCLLLHFGSAEDPALAMIDGGPAGVYQAHLRQRLMSIRDSRGLSDAEALPIDLLMISHVDDDHIHGILDLTREMIEEKDAHRPLFLNVRDFWHNSFDTIIGRDPKELTSALGNHFGPASLNGELPDDATLDDDLDWPNGRPDEEVILSNLKVLANVKQGHQLRVDAKKLKFPLNEEFGGKLIIAEKGGEALDMGGGLSLTVVGPMKPEVVKLQKEHDQWLKKLKKEGTSPPAALAAYIDQSVANLSSIVVLAEADGKRMLLTGDARGDKVLQGLELAGLIGPDNDSKIAVDILKVPHHGSANNLDDDFFERIIAKHYVFSGNGEHGNPEREALEMLVRARGTSGYTIHLTYPIDDIDVEREKDWKKEQKKEKKRKQKKPDTFVRPDWTPAKHSLAAFIAKNGGLAERIRIVDEEKPHLIDLLDKIPADD